MNLAPFIEHTNLNDNATEEDIRRLCQEALDNKFLGVCVYPKFVHFAKAFVKNKCKVVTVVGFPSGAISTNEKVNETVFSVQSGADEIDMVINKEALKANNDAYVLADIKAVVEAASKKLVKVIIEATELTHEEKERAVKLVMQAGAHIVKTSTGKSPNGGAMVEDVALIKSIVGNKLGIKAAGGISDAAKAEELIRAGATRLGTSKSLKIIGKE